MFSEAGFDLDVWVTAYAGHAREIARTFALDHYNSLCVIGGDGTVHEVASGLIERGESASIPLGLIPAGTGNDVAKQFGVNNPPDAVRRIVAGRTSPFDVAKVEAAGQTDYCVTIVGWAGVAGINCTAERLRMLGPPRYAVAALWHILFPKRRKAKLILDHQSFDGDFLQRGSSPACFVQMITQWPGAYA